MGTLLWIVTFGLLMGLIALIGSVTLILPESLLERVLEPLVGLAAGSLLGGAFVIDVSLGITAWLAAAAHEVPQELGDFAVLVRGGWPKGRALLWNLMSALTFLVGGIVAWAASFGADVTALLPFAAGNFIYIGAADLIPAVATPDSDDTSRRVTGSAAFVAGLVLLYLLA